MAKDDDIFHNFVFEGRRYAKAEVEQAARTVQQKLSSAERKQVNDLLLQKLDKAKKAHKHKSNTELLDVPAISTLVNTLIIVNEPWITKAIARTIRQQPQLRRSAVEELHSTALTGNSTQQGTVGGVMNAILEYDYLKYGVSSFTRYLARTISNTLQPTSHQKKAYLRLYARMQPLHGFGEAKPGWIDRIAAMTPPPFAAAINHDLLEVIHEVIPRLPSPQQRFTAEWMLERIRATGELPFAWEVAQKQRPPVSRERGRQIMEATLNNIRSQIETDYPQLAEGGINGWEEFRQAFGDLHQKVRLDRPNGFRR